MWQEALGQEEEMVFAWLLARVARPSKGRTKADGDFDELILVAGNGIHDAHDLVEGIRAAPRQQLV